MQKSSILVPYSVQIAEIFCNLNTVRDWYGGFLHESLRAFKRLCNVNAAIVLLNLPGSMFAFGAGLGDKSNILLYCPIRV